MFELMGDSADELYDEACFKFDMSSMHEESRNGDVWSIPDLSLITLHKPHRRILHNKDRDANPFFHLMEALWMWAGRNDAKFLLQFNKHIGEYADNGVFNAAYGYRWQHHFGYNQLTHVRNQIVKDPLSRQHVIQMWDPVYDTMQAKDKACNTQIMFRIRFGRLNMTVMNRSNDLVWGAQGANIVHMTMLHELMAHTCGLEMGTYRVVSNNLHVYEPHWKLLNENSGYTGPIVDPTPVGKSNDLESWLLDAGKFCDGATTRFENNWFLDVAVPMRDAYLDRENRLRHILNVKCPAWREAALQWSERRAK